MLSSLRQFLANEEGSLVANHLMLVATILVLGAALSLIALERATTTPPHRTVPLHQHQQPAVETTPRSP